MFSQTAIEAVEPTTVGVVHRHRHSNNTDSRAGDDDAAFFSEFPSSMLDGAIAFALDVAAKKKKTSASVDPAGAAKIAVQLCDNSLPRSVKLIHELEKRAKEYNSEKLLDFFVLADSTYAPCCADQVTAQRNNADAILHFGQTCFSHSVESLPVAFFVPPWHLFADDEQTAVAGASGAASGSSSDSTCTIDIAQRVAPALEAAANAQVSSVVFVLAAGVAAEEVEELRSRVLTCCGAEKAQALEKQCLFVTCGSQEREGGEGGTAATASSIWNVDGARFPVVRSGKQIVFFIGPEVAADSLHQLTLIEYWNSAARMKKEEEDDDDAKTNAAVASWLMHLPIKSDAASSSSASSRHHMAAARDVQRRVNQRMRNVEALSNASSVGLLVLTLSISEQRSLLQKLQHMLRVGGKRVYVVFIGHLNEFKLANFHDSIDVFVSLACPNSRPANFASKEDNFNVPLLFPAEVSLWYERDVKKVPEEAVAERFMQPEQYTTRSGVRNVVRAAGDAAAELKKVNVEQEVNDQAGAAAAAAAAAAAESSSSSSAAASSSAATVKEGVVLVAPKMHIATTRSGGEGTLQRFQQRVYQGLQPRLGEDAVQENIVDGLSGIARGYETVQSYSSAKK